MRVGRGLLPDGAQWTLDLDERHLEAVLGDVTLSRGRVYQRQGRVVDLDAATDGSVLTASVRGSRRRPYTTTIRLEGLDRVGQPSGPRPSEAAGSDAGVSWSNVCSCPLKGDCKHVAATVVEVQAHLGSRRPSRSSSQWEAALAGLLRPPGGGVHAREHEPLGLLVEVRRPDPRGEPVTASAGTATLRPVVVGANGGWVRTGVGWSDLDYGFRAARADPSQRAALQAFSLRQRARNPYSYSSPQTLELGALGAEVWRLLDGAVQSGVALVSGHRGQMPVYLHPEAISGGLDLTRSADGAVRVRAVLDLPELAVAGGPQPVQLLGSPPHGVVVPTADGSVLLARFEAPLDPTLTEMLGRVEPVVVPATDVARFLTQYYPSVRQRVGVGSVDGSVELPEVHPPHLALRVVVTGTHRLELRWAFRYPVGDQDVDVPLLRSQDVDPRQQVVARDGEAEERLIAAVVDVTELGAVPGLLVQKPGWHRRSLVVAPVLSGMDTVTFVRGALAALQAREDVDVEVVGELLTYTESTQAPVIAVAADERGPASPASDAQSPELEGTGLDWFDLDISVTVDGHDVPVAALLRALADDEHHLILDNGVWFALDRDELQTLRRIVEEARALDDRPGAGLRLNRFHAGLWGDLVELGVVTRQSERWSRTVGALLGLTELPRPPVPETVVADLRPYQLEGYHWLSLLWDHDLGGILADDMGLGKTVQTLAMAERARVTGSLEPGSPLLVVAPTSVVGTWAREAARFTPELRVATVTETARRRGSSLVETVVDAHVVVTSYTLFRLEQDDYVEQSWRGLVLDEAQFVKNHQARTYAAARRLPAPFKLAITGTPLENSLMDLWSLLSITAPGLFPSPQRFAELYRRPIESGAAPELLETLRRRIRPLMLRRAKESVAPELPPKVEQVLSVALHPAHQRHYDRRLARERQRVLGLLGDVDRNRVAILSALTTLRQLSLDVHLVEADAPDTVRSAKVDALIDQLVEVVAEGHRVLVFSQFTRFLSIVRKRLDVEGIGHVYLDGRTRDRPRRIAQFTDGDDPVFVISLKAGGSGLTLTEADYVFVLDPWWNPAAEAQAIDRAHRIGQDKTVMVYRLVSAGTIEEKVLELQERKRELFTKVVDEGGLMGAPLSADDIRGLLGP